MAKKPAPLTSDLLVRKGEATPSSINPADRSSDMGPAGGGAQAAPLSTNQGNDGRPQTPEPEIVLAADEDTDIAHGSRRRLAAVLGLVAVVTAGVLAFSMFGPENPSPSVAPVNSGGDVAALETPTVAPVISTPGPQSVGAPSAPATPGLQLDPTEVTPESGADSSAPPTIAAEPIPTDPIVVETDPVMPPREAATITPPQSVTPGETAAPEVAVVTAAEPAAPTIATSGQYLIQILSVRTESAARAAWSRAQAAHEALLGGETLNIERADLEERGTYYRVRFGAFNARSNANAVCKSLKAEGQDCLVKRVN